MQALSATSNHIPHFENRTAMFEAFKTEPKETSQKIHTIFQGIKGDVEELECQRKELGERCVKSKSIAPTAVSEKTLEVLYKIKKEYVKNWNPLDFETHKIQDEQLELLEKMQKSATLEYLDENAIFDLKSLVKESEPLKYTLILFSIIRTALLMDSFELYPGHSNYKEIMEGLKEGAEYLLKCMREEMKEPKDLEIYKNNLKKVHQRICKGREFNHYDTIVDDLLKSIKSEVEFVNGF